MSHTVTKRTADATPCVHAFGMLPKSASCKIDQREFLHGLARDVGLKRRHPLPSARTCPLFRGPRLRGIRRPMSLFNLACCAMFLLCAIAWHAQCILRFGTPFTLSSLVISYSSTLSTIFHVFIPISLAASWCYLVLRCGSSTSFLNATSRFLSCLITTPSFTFHVSACRIVLLPCIAAWHVARPLIVLSRSLSSLIIVRSFAFHCVSIEISRTVPCCCLVLRRGGWPCGHRRRQRQR